jgi:hypothetical protein
MMLREENCDIIPSAEAQSHCTGTTVFTPLERAQNTGLISHAPNSCGNHLLIWAVLVLLGATLLMSCSAQVQPQSHKPALLGNICLVGPIDAQPGPRGSIYVLDRSRILRLSTHGRLLARLGTTDSTIAVDPVGNLYRQLDGHIQELSPNGRLLRQWPVGGMHPMAVDGHGKLLVTDDPDTNDRIVVELLSTHGQLLGRWRTTNSAMMAFDRTGALYGIDTIGSGGLVQLDPTTGRVQRRFDGAASFGTITVDSHGTVYVGATVNGDVPFAVQRLTQRHGHYTLETINLSEEEVNALAVADDGRIFVIRGSYEEASPTNTRLDVLSAHGQLIGTFRSCSKS